jgi:hemoglobin
MMIRALRLVTPLLSVFLCASILASELSLYQRLGGEIVVTKIVEQTIKRVVDDPEVNQSFHKVDLVKLDKLLVEQICSLTGGGCKYSGEDMKTVHAGLNITEREFYAMVEALRAELDSHNIGEREKNELLRILAPMKRDVITK